MKNIITLGTVAVAAVAGASTNYVELAARRCNLVTTIADMKRDPSLSDPAAFRAALEELDRNTATCKVLRGGWALSKRCPETVRAVFARNTTYSEKVRAEIVAGCGYDAENTYPSLTRNDSGYVNYRLQSACIGNIHTPSVRNEVLGAAIVPVRRHIRASGISFVGKEGGRKVKEILDALATELNAPRFGRTDEILARFGIEVEGEFIRSKMLTDDEIVALRKRLLDGEIAFSPILQNKLCIALGIDAYNAFVKEYNGK